MKYENKLLFSKKLKKKHPKIRKDEGNKRNDRLWAILYILMLHRNENEKWEDEINWGNQKYTKFKF